MGCLWKPATIGGTGLVFLVWISGLVGFEQPKTEVEWVREVGPAMFGDDCQIEVMMPDGTRCDILTKDLAVEVDWATKWKTGPGQALLYSALTNKRPAVLLLVKDYRKEKAHILRCCLVCEMADIDFYTVKVGGE